MWIGSRLKIAPVRSIDRATSPEQICWPSTKKLNFAPVSSVNAMLAMVTNP